jgi:uncharacterized cupin superfamily protein
MPKIEAKDAVTVQGSRYPAPFDEPCKTRVNTRLGDAAGLTQFGVVLTRLPPGAWSGQRHWHEHEDEFAQVLEGEVVLVEDAGERVLTAGDCAGFRAGSRDGHQFINRSQADVLLLVVGGRDDRDWGEYPDIDMKFHPGRYSSGANFTRKDGSKF